MSSWIAAISVGYFNSDNHLDIVVTHPLTATIGFLFGIGDGNFKDEVELQLENNSMPYDVAVNDLNNDKLSDLVVTLANDDRIAVLLSNAEGIFQEYMTVSIGNDNNSLGPIAINDFNNDGLMDVVVVEDNVDNLYILLGNGDGTFGTRITLSKGYTNIPTCFSVTDLNGDDLADIVMVQNYNDHIDILLSNGTGTTRTHKTVPTTNMMAPISIDFGDFNNDNKVDIVFGTLIGQGIGVMLCNSDDTFRQPSMYLIDTGSTLDQVVVNDFNKDHQLDIVFFDIIRNTIGYVIGNGDGTFSNPIIIITLDNYVPGKIVAGDFNSDDSLDIVYIESHPRAVGMLLNTC